MNTKYNQFLKISLFSGSGLVVQGYCSVVIFTTLADVFPSNFSTPYWQLYLELGVSWLAMLICSLLYGCIGDYWGRKKSLLLSIIIIASFMFIFGLLPSPSPHIHPETLKYILLFMSSALPFIIIGEKIGAFIYALESASTKRQGLYGGVFWFIFSGIGLILGSTVMYGLGHFLSLPHQQFIAWGWRLRFFIGSFLAIIVFIIRLYMPESVTFLQMKQNEKALTTARKSSTLKGSPQRNNLNILLVAMLTATTLFSLVYVHKFMEKWPYSSFLLATAIIISGFLSDRIGRMKLLISGLCGLAIISIPLYCFEAYNLLGMTIVSFSLLIIFAGIYIGPFSALIVEATPVKGRYLSIGLAFTLAYYFSHIFEFIYDLHYHLYAPLGRWLGPSYPDLCEYLDDIYKTLFDMPVYLIISTLLSGLALFILHQRRIKHRKNPVET